RDLRNGRLRPPRSRTTAAPKIANAKPPNTSARMIRIGVSLACSSTNSRAETGNSSFIVNGQIDCCVWAFVRRILRQEDDATIAVACSQGPDYMGARSQA